MRIVPRLAQLLFAALLAAGCAHSHGVVVPRAPEVVVRSFVPLVTTPEVIKFQSVLAIQNQMDAPIRFSRVEYGADLFDKAMFSDTFTDLKETDEHDSQTVTFPFQLALKDILASSAPLLAKGKIRVTFHGTLYAEDPAIAPVPFTQTLELPLPKVPELKYLGSEGMPLSPQFRVRVGLKNPNGFPITLQNVVSYLDLNGERYRLVHSDDPAPVQPGEQEVVTLQMENSTGKMLSMFVNVVSSRAAHFTLGGSVTFATPYGALYLPVSVSDQ